MQVHLMVNGGFQHARSTVLTSLLLTVLYLLFTGDLPYVLALDRPTKSVVVAIRGTVSIADLATDMLADPEPMEEWLPKKMQTQVRGYGLRIHLLEQV